ncbi:MAG: M20 family metallopeptidase [Chloroflexi bacterium]|nr:M20 family metallopeptidase [Chloroflexota bacterium]
MERAKVARLKADAAAAVDARRDSLCELSRRIHDTPELGFKEVMAARWLTQYLEKDGFAIERGICDLPTAFRASLGKGRPAVAFLAEYDALPDVGHACGHNLIATVAAGAAVASRIAIEQLGGTVLVIGTPAEELYGGKVIMASKGAFDNLDAAMILHPDTLDIATTRALACQGLEVEFFGKAAHAAARPEAGVNALEAMIQSFNAINALRQHIKPTARIHGIITDGGKAANVVPAHSAGSFLVRAADDSYLDELKEKVINCFLGAGEATGARLQYKWDDTRYATMRNNLTLARLFVQNMEFLGRKVVLGEPGSGFGSTDMGNVSHIVPAIHPFVAIASRDVMIHTPEFAAAAAADGGIKGMLDGAKALAMTAVDLLADPATLASVRDEFERGK